MPPPSFTLARPDSSLALRGIRVLLAGPEPDGSLLTTSSPELQARIDHFLVYAASTSLDITRQVLALTPSVTAHLDLVRGMCLWVPSPGRTSLLFTPSLSEYPDISAMTTAAIAGAIEDARLFGTRLAQAMVEPADAATKTAFAAAGMLQLATLSYMERKAPTLATLPPPTPLPEGFSLTPYSDDFRDLFLQTILHSYEQTLDCPALSGMRDPDDVIDGHKGAGPFDPSLWLLLRRGEEAVGCLLLANVPARQAIELVYLGLTPSVRGLGLGSILLKRTLAEAARVNCELITLAVDANNAPALRIYRRAGFTATAQRVAFIRKLG